MHFLDTCICIEFLRGNLKVGYQMLRESNPAEFMLPSIVAAELLFGAEHSSNPLENLKTVEAFISVFEIAPFDLECARRYASIRQALGAKGKLIGDRDIMIASCALAHDAVLVTNNLQEFKRVPGLRIESWADPD